MTTTVARHAAALAGLAALRDFIEAHPDLPLGTGPYPFSVCPRGTGEEERAEVRRIAGILGVRPRPAGGRYVAERDFGGGVTYQATAVLSADMERLDRHMQACHEDERLRAAALKAAA